MPALSTLLTAQVVGLAQSDASAAKIVKLGGTALRGTLDDLDIIQQAAKDSDGGALRLTALI